MVRINSQNLLLVLIGAGIAYLAVSSASHPKSDSDPDPEHAPDPDDAPYDAEPKKKTPSISALKSDTHRRRLFPFFNKKKPATSKVAFMKSPTTSGASYVYVVVYGKKYKVKKQGLSAVSDLKTYIKHKLGLPVSTKLSLVLHGVAVSSSLPVSQIPNLSTLYVVVRE